MASIFVMTDPMSEVYYSLKDNRVRKFNLHGKTLYDEYKGVSAEGWEDALVKFVKQQRLNIDGGEGLPSFVYGLIDRGLLED